MGSLMLKLFLLLFLPLYGGDVRDYLQPAPRSSASSQMRNIDFIYLINLDERPEKLALSLQKLAPYHITPCRFPAINGWNLPLDALNHLGVQCESWMSNGHFATYYGGAEGKTPLHELFGIPGRTYFCHCMPLGAIGCVLSHLSVLQAAFDAGYQTIWVIEDDIEVVQNPHLLSDLIDELDEAVGLDGWDVLFTDPDTKNTDGIHVPCTSYAWRPNYTPPNPHHFAEKKEVGAHFRQIGARYGSYSMILRRSGIKKILNFIKCYQLFLPYDMEYTQPANIRLFALKEDLVSTLPRAPSDNGAPNYILNPKGWQTDD